MAVKDMGNLLDKVKKEFDPRHDFDRVDTLWNILNSSYGRKPYIKSFVKVVGGALCYYADAMVKHTLRYGVIGAGVGALGSCIVGEGPEVGALWGGGIVASIDACQYGLRSAIIPPVRDFYNYFKKSPNIKASP